MDAKTDRYRRERGTILRILLKVYPDPLNYMTVYVLLEDLGHRMTRDVFEGHLAYLSHASKGYVERHAVEAGGLKAEHLTITPRGIDLMGNLKSVCDDGVATDV
jgi:hypothetical protein